MVDLVSVSVPMFQAKDDEAKAVLVVGGEVDEVEGVGGVPGAGQGWTMALRVSQATLEILALTKPGSSLTLFGC